MVDGDGPPADAGADAPPQPAHVPSIDSSRACAWQVDCMFQEMHNINGTTLTDVCGRFVRVTGPLLSQEQPPAGVQPSQLCTITCGIGSLRAVTIPASWLSRLQTMGVHVDVGSTTWAPTSAAVTAACQTWADRSRALVFPDIPNSVIRVGLHDVDRTVSLLLRWHSRSKLCCGAYSDSSSTYDTRAGKDYRVDSESKFLLYGKVVPQPDLEHPANVYSVGIQPGCPEVLRTSTSTRMVSGAMESFVAVGAEVIRSPPKAGQGQRVVAPFPYVPVIPAYRNAGCSGIIDDDCGFKLQSSLFAGLHTCKTCRNWRRNTVQGVMTATRKSVKLKPPTTGSEPNTAEPNTAEPNTASSEPNTASPEPKPTSAKLQLRDIPQNAPGYIQRRFAAQNARVHTAYPALNHSTVPTVSLAICDGE
jgi:hypothetical protein